VLKSTKSDASAVSATPAADSLYQRPMFSTSAVGLHIFQAGLVSLSPPASPFAADTFDTIGIFGIFSQFVLKAER
jgi:hypothetical protein